MRQGGQEVGQMSLERSGWCWWWWVSWVVLGAAYTADALQLQFVNTGRDAALGLGLLPAMHSPTDHGARVLWMFALAPYFSGPGHGFDHHVLRR